VTAALIAVLLTASPATPNGASGVTPANA